MDKDFSQLDLIWAKITNTAKIKQFQVKHFRISMSFMSPGKNGNQWNVLNVQ